MFGIGLSKVFVGLGLESMSHVALPLAYHCLLFLLIAIFLGKLHIVDKVGVRFLNGDTEVT